MTYRNLPRRTGSDRVLCDKGFVIVKDSKFDGYQRGIASMFHNFFDENAFSGVVTHADKSANKSEIMTNQRPSDLFHIAKFSGRTQQIGEELHESVIKI